MVFVQAVDPNEIAQSTIEVEEAVWAVIEAPLRAALAAKGYAIVVLSYVAKPGSSDAPEENVTDLAAALRWARDLDADED